MNQFKSKFAINELVRFEENKDTGECSYGFIRNIKFWKSDAVNHACSYTIEKVNCKDFANEIPEAKIQRAYHEV